MSYIVLAFLYIVPILRAIAKPVGDAGDGSVGQGEASSSAKGFHWQDEPSVQPWSPPTLDTSLRLGKEHTPFESSPYLENPVAHWNAPHSAFSFPHSVSSATQATHFADQPERGKEPVTGSVHDMNTLSSLLSPRVQDRLKIFEQETSSKHSEMVTWQNVMRKALGNPTLEFISVDKQNPEQPRIFVARDAHNAEDHHLTKQGDEPPVLGPEGDASTPNSHFVRWVRNAKKVAAKDVYKGHPHNRMIVYLQSRYNMRFISDEYFQGRMRFLPVDPDQLSWVQLNSLHRNEIQVVLPPRTEHGLPVIINRHEPDSGVTRDLQKITGDLTYRKHIVTIWSPVIHERTRHTIVLYGISQLDMAQASRDKTLVHLEHLANSWTHDSFAAAYYLASDFPKKGAV